jgi:D-aspartate ligase
MHSAVSRRGGRPLTRAIVLGISGHPRALATVRSLGRVGIRVIGVENDDPRPAQASHSRYVSERFRVSARPDRALPFLESLSESGGGVLICLDDEYLLLVARHFAELSRYFTLTVPPWEVLRRVIDHADLYQIARQIGLRTPAFYRPRDEGELRRIVAGLDLQQHEYLLKTVPGTVPAEPSNGRYTKVAGPDAASIWANCGEIASRLGAYPLIVEVVPGEADQCIGVSMVVDDAQEPVLAYCTRRLKLYTYSRGGFIHPYELGAVVYCESVHDPEALDAAQRLVRATGYSGAITVEFRRDSRDGSLILIKCDPRVVRNTSLSTALGMDIPTTIYRLATGQPVEVARGYPAGVGWLWATMYLETLWNNRSNRLVRQELLRLCRSFRRMGAFALWSTADPLPFWMHIQWWGRGWMRRRARGLVSRLKQPFGAGSPSLVR